MILDFSPVRDATSMRKQEASGFALHSLRYAVFISLPFSSTNMNFLIINLYKVDDPAEILLAHGNGAIMKLHPQVMGKAL